MHRTHASGLHDRKQRSSWAQPLCGTTYAGQLEVVVPLTAGWTVFFDASAANTVRDTSTRVRVLLGVRTPRQQFHRWCDRERYAGGVVGAKRWHRVECRRHPEGDRVIADVATRRSTEEWSGGAGKQFHGVVHQPWDHTGHVADVGLHPVYCFHRQQR